MTKLTFPNNLPPTSGMHPDFRSRFSGWQLGMALPDTLDGLLSGLTALAQDNPGCNAVAHGMALWGVQFHPLSSKLAQWAHTLSASGLHLPDHLARCLVQTVAAPEIDTADATALDTWHSLVRQGDRPTLLRFLNVSLRDSSKGLSWLGKLWTDLIHLGRPEVARAALDMVPWNDATAPLMERMDAEFAFHCQDPETALHKVESLDPEAWGLWRAYAGAELLLRMERRNEALGVLSFLWKAAPWHVNLTLKLYDLYNPAPLADDTEAGDAAVLLYSWNKAELLGDTLKSLTRSRLGSAPVFALDNGSTDATADVLRQAQDRFGADRFHIETLPVNVGAPAARNWLLSLPEVQARPFAAFLDDDVVLPTDWLLHLLGVSKAHSDVGVVGCRITSASAPFGLQSADYNMFPTPPREPEPGRLPNRVMVFDNCAGSVDTGLFTYSRPCLSVSGCCHLVSMRAVAKAGGFDLRFTPSQFDDLDRDMRSAMEGLPAVYTGGLAVRHVQHSSLAKSQTVRQIGHVMGNKFKLDAKYSDEQLIKLGEDNKDRLWDDLERKHAFLVQRLELTA